jgi:uncharacterized protein
MIDATEVRSLAATAKADPGIVEKDYVLSKVLMALSASEAFQAVLVFKGGTALRKCYYPEWRFSEDLDFTGTKPLKRDEVKGLFTEAATAAIKQSGVPLRIIEYSQYPKSGADIMTAQLKIGYDGPLRKSSGQKNNVRVDIAFDEILVAKPVLKSIHRQYTDDVETEVNVYPMEEILAEKLRSILQRGKSRDYFDVWLLLKGHAADMSLGAARDILLKKCRFKSIRNPSVDDFLTQDRTEEAGHYWERGLGHQMAELPEFPMVLRDLQTHLASILKA